jgi:hypothetical protein
MNPTTPTSAMSQGATFMRPASQDAHQEVLDAVQRAVHAVPEQGFPIDLTFPGENEPDQVDAWISAYAEPFYIRA